MSKALDRFNEDFSKIADNEKAVNDFLRDREQMLK